MYICVYVYIWIYTTYSIIQKPRENDLRCLQLLDVLHLNRRDLLDDGVHILGADLVQQACTPRS